MTDCLVVRDSGGHYACDHLREQIAKLERELEDAKLLNWVLLNEPERGYWLALRGGEWSMWLPNEPRMSLGFEREPVLTPEAREALKRARGN